LKHLSQTAENGRVLAKLVSGCSCTYPCVKLNARESLRTDGTKVLLDQLAWDVGNNGLIAPVVVAVSTVHNTGDASQ
jgi:hypothetical protein